mmetsp:Transcript_10097/g.42973  ORF Transcript_10097/g.42973 Transcript_10097/m.42973 type:complete len:222 (+) Transcript_10097:307-972(+)
MTATPRRRAVATRGSSQISPRFARAPSGPRWWSSPSPRRRSQSGSRWATHARPRRRSCAPRPQEQQNYTTTYNPIHTPTPASRKRARRSSSISSSPAPRRARSFAESWLTRSAVAARCVSPARCPRSVGSRASWCSAPPPTEARSGESWWAWAPARLPRRRFCSPPRRRRRRRARSPWRRRSWRSRWDSRSCTSSRSSRVQLKITPMSIPSTPGRRMTRRR